jgi:hypothetical protein
MKRGPRTAPQPTFRSDLGRLANSLTGQPRLLAKPDVAVASSFN